MINHYHINGTTLANDKTKLEWSKTKPAVYRLDGWVDEREVDKDVYSPLPI
jgi:hypothetical protein